MKKAIIAGAASAVLAAMPVAGVFAVPSAQSVKDQLNLTVSPTCSITRTAHADKSTSTETYQGTFTGGNDQIDASYAMTLGTGSMGTFGMSTFGVSCNDQTNGFKVSAKATGLTSTSSDAATNATIEYLQTGAVSNQVSGWNVTLGRPSETTIPAWNTTNVPSDGVNANIPQLATGAVVDLFDTYTGSSVLSNSATFTATYKAGVKADQPAGLYTGSVTYTLTYGA